MTTELARLWAALRYRQTCNRIDANNLALGCAAAKRIAAAIRAHDPAKVRRARRRLK